MGLFYLEPKTLYAAPTINRCWQFFEPGVIVQRTEAVRTGQSINYVSGIHPF